MRSRVRFAVLALAVVVIAGLAYYFLRPREPENVLKASGTIEATKVDVSFQISGRVSELPVREGQTVKEGDLLGRLSPDELNARVQQIQASLDSIISQAAQQAAALDLRRGVVEN